MPDLLDHVGLHQVVQENPFSTRVVCIIRLNVWSTNEDNPIFGMKDWGRFRLWPGAENQGRGLWRCSLG